MKTVEDILGVSKEQLFLLYDLYEEDYGINGLDYLKSCEEEEKAEMLEDYLDMI